MSVSHRPSIRSELIHESCHPSSSHLDKRSKLHTSSTLNWLRTRHQNTANLNYLFLPEEIQTHYEVQDVFNLIDEDKSGKLALQEFYHMFKKANIKIEMEDLKNFYRKVDNDGDTALDFHEFKNCTLSDEANLCFAKMMNHVKSNTKDIPNEIRPPMESSDKKQVIEIDDEAKDSVIQKPFLPRTFGTLLNYLAYLNKKQDLVKSIKEDPGETIQKFHRFADLIDLQMDKDIYLEHFNTKLNFKSQNSINLPLTARSSKNNCGTRQSISLDTRKKSEIYQGGQPIANQKKSNLEERKEFLKEIKEMAERTRQEAINDFYKRKRNKDPFSISPSRPPTCDFQQVYTPRYKNLQNLKAKRITPNDLVLVNKEYITITNNSPRAADSKLNIINMCNLKQVHKKLSNKQHASNKKATDPLWKEFKILDNKKREDNCNSDLKYKLSLDFGYENSVPTKFNLPFRSHRESSSNDTNSCNNLGRVHKEIIKGPVNKPKKVSSMCDAIPSYDWTNSNKTSKRQSFLGPSLVLDARVHPNSTRTKPVSILEDIKIKSQEGSPRSKNNPKRTTLDLIASFQESLASRLKFELSKKEAQKAIQLKGKRIQPLSLDSSINKKS